MLNLLYVIYGCIGMVWISICIDRGRLLPKTVGDFIMTLICCPFVSLVIIVFNILKPLDKIIEWLLVKENTQKATVNFMKFWNKEL